MRIAASVIGWFAWAASGWHLLWSSFHQSRANVHAARKAVHDERAEERIAEAARIETAARTLAPRKPKAVAPPSTPKVVPPPPTAKPVPYQRGQPLAVVARVPEDTQ